MIASMGLLTPEGLDHFYPIFEDYENMSDEKRGMDKFLYSGLTPYNGELGKAKIRWETNRKDQYREWLKSVSGLRKQVSTLRSVILSNAQKHWTRDTFRSSPTEIKIKCIAVWDTVGALGITRGTTDVWRYAENQASSSLTKGVN